MPEPTDTTTTTPAAAPPPEETIQRAIDDPLLGPLVEDLQAMIGPDKPIVIKPAPEEEPPPPAAKVVEKPPANPKVGVKPRPDMRAIAAEVVDQRLAAQKPPEAPLTLPPPTKPVETPNADAVFSKEQRDEIADAIYAERNDPEYKGMAERLRRFYRDADAWVAEHKNDEDRTFDKDDVEFMSFIGRNKPDWKGNRDHFRIERIADARAESKISERERIQEDRMKEVDRTAKAALAAPYIERTIEGFRSKIEEDTKTDDPMHGAVYLNYRQSAEQLAGDYLRILHGVDKFNDSSNPKDLNERHSWILNFIKNQADYFADKGGEARTRNGASFLPPDKYAALARNDPEKARRHWTFTQDDILNTLRSFAVLRAKDEIQAEETRMTKLGYSKSPKQTTKSSTESPKPSSGVKATTTPAPGASDSSDNQDLNHPGREIIDILGLAA